MRVIHFVMPLCGMLFTQPVFADDLPPIAFPIAVKPANDPGQWVRHADYPAEEIKRGVEGVAGFRVSVSRSGKVTSCEITSSSGSELLDAITCEKISKRAVFHPVKDHNGKPTTGQYARKLDKDIVDAPGSVTRLLTYDFDRDGNLLTCSVAVTYGGALDALYKPDKISRGDEKASCKDSESIAKEVVEGLASQDIATSAIFLRFRDEFSFEENAGVIATERGQLMGRYDLALEPDGTWHDCNYRQGMRGEDISADRSKQSAEETALACAELAQNVHSTFRFISNGQPATIWASAEFSLFVELYDHSW